MRILLTGYPGLLSPDLIPVLQTRHEVTPLTINELDITQKADVLLTLEKEKDKHAKPNGCIS